MSEPASDRITVPALVARKAGRAKIVALTAYDFPTAEILDRMGVDLILVGDSLGMVVLGYEDTVAVTLDDVLHHTKAVVRAVRRALVVADMPFLSFHVSAEDALRNAGRMLQEGGAHAVKIEGGSPRRLEIVRALVQSEIPVLGHVGLTPQSILRLGQFKVQGGDAAEAARIVGEAEALQDAGVFGIVLECIPREVAAEITRRLAVPTIGIGAGSSCDGQILVLHDLVGFSHGYNPKFVRRYADIDSVIAGAVDRYGQDVRAGRFPDDSHSYHLKPGQVRGFLELAKRRANEPRPKRGRR